MSSIRRLSPTNQHIAKLIRDQREQQDMSLQAFGSALGVTKQAVNYWERGLYRPSTEVLFKIKQTAADEWARQLAMDCLSLRFPDQIINGTNGKTEPVN